MSAARQRNAVAVGGGTGLPSVIRCLLDLGYSTSAVVTMADDGGSSGMLRRQLGMLPPGDIRNCLVAMADDDANLISQLFQYRFPHGEGLAGHALGNLVIAALADLTGSFPAAIEAVEGYLHARGHVLPSTLADVELHGVDRAGATLSGQAKLATNPEALARVRLQPARPLAYPPVLDAIRAADVIVIGPGSLYTSLIPNFLVDGISRALHDSTATRVYVCNVANMRGETGGLDAADHVTALFDHGLAGAIDIVLAHEPEPCHEHLCDDDARVEPVAFDHLIRARIEALGPRVVTADLADEADPVRHSREALCRLLERVIA